MITDSSGSGFTDRRAFPDVRGLTHESLHEARLVRRTDRTASGPDHPLIAVMCRAKLDVSVGCKKAESTSTSRKADRSRERAAGRCPDPSRSRADRAGSGAPSAGTRDRWRPTNHVRRTTLKNDHG